MGNPNFLDGTDMINVGKFRIILKVIEDLEKYQGMSYADIQNCENLRLLIETAEVLDEESLYQESLKVGLTKLSLNK